MSVSEYGTARVARTARVQRTCDECRGKVLPGHRYLRIVLFPCHDGNSSKRPSVFVECVECAVGHGRELETGACPTYCCGVTVCHLPYQHKSDHRCPRCENHRAPHTTTQCVVV